MAAVWDGARNHWDLGGLPLGGGGTTAYGRVWRSAAPESMTDAGWEAARRAGLSTVVDLRNDVERADVVERSGVAVVHAPTEDPDDPRFLAECGPWLDHPRSWTPNTARYPEKFARVFTAIADAPGGVLVHCAGGRDRTGLVVSMLLVLAGVEPEAVASHYEECFREAAAHGGHGLAFDPALGEWQSAAEEPRAPDDLDQAIADRRPALRQWLDTTDVASYLTAAGLDAPRLARLASLLLGE